MSRREESMTATDFIHVALTPTEIMTEIMARDDKHFEAAQVVRAMLAQVRGKLEPLGELVDDHFQVTVADDGYGDLKALALETKKAR
jgi:hypothetical protein